MSFGSFLRGIAAQVNPFDNGQTYGTFNPPDKKKKDDQDQFGTPAPAPRPYTPNLNQNFGQPQAQKPQNLFRGLNNDLQLPSAPNNNANASDFTARLQQGRDQQQRQRFGIPGYVTKLYRDSNGNITGYQDPRKMQDVQVVPNRPQAPPRPGPSILHRITHNPVTNVVGNIGKTAASPFVYLAKTDIINPTRELAAEFSGNKQAEANARRQSNIDLGLGAQGTDIKHGLEKFAGNSAGALLTAAAPGASRLLEGTASRFLPKTAPTVLRKVAPRVFAGSQIGGAFNASNSVANGDVNPTDLLKAYGTGMAIGGGAEAGLPLLGRLIPKFLRRNRDVVEGETPIVTDELASAESTPTQIPVQQVSPISVTAPTSEPVRVPVINRRSVGKPIIDVTGDRPGRPLPTPSQVANQRARDAFNNQPPPRLNPNVEGVAPYQASPETLTSAEIQTERDALDEALANKEINKTQHKAANKALDQASAVDQPPTGRKIAVKQASSIPVEGAAQTATVPANLPETPGKVRVTSQAAPANAEAVAVAARPKAAPQAAAPAQLPLPAETQTILANPRRFSRREVAAARRNLRNAQKMAQTAEDTAAAADRITSAKPTSNKGFVPTGEFRKGVRGNVTEVAHRSTEAAQAAHDTANLSVSDVLQQARDEVAENGKVSDQTIRNLKDIRDSGRFPRTSIEFKAVNNEYENAISGAARTTALADRVIRAHATGDKIANRFLNKLQKNMADTKALSKAHIKQIEDAENAFTQARDMATALGERFKATDSEADFRAWQRADAAAKQADRQARITEFLVAKDALKGNKNLNALKAIQESEKRAGVYSMDPIDANMLSGTGTMVRNYINTLFPRAENKLFGRVSSRVAPRVAQGVSKFRPGTDSELVRVGGSSGRGARIGSKIGRDMFKADVIARKQAGVGRIRRVVTAGNTVGERNIQATAYSKAFDHYRQVLRDEGYRGAELNRRAEFRARTDSDGLVAQYEADTLRANALSSLAHTDKFENRLANALQKKLAGAGVGVKGQMVGRFGAKAVTRVGVGFPTVIARSLVEGVKRATLGVPEILLSTAKFFLTGNKERFAQELSKAFQHAGSGGSLMLLGAVLGKMGAISGAYPKDPAERAAWKAEGRQANSIKIGGQWFNIPGYLGGFSIPLMFGATMSSGDASDETTAKNAWSTILSASPVENIQSTLGILTGDSSDSVVKNSVTSLVRSMTPAGSFIAELAKLTDRTANDTTRKSAIRNIVDQIASGIPVVNNRDNKTDKIDSFGNVIHNPNPIATILGAQGSEQKQGVQDVQQQQGASDKTFKQLAGYGVLRDKNLSQLIDPELAKRISSGQQLTPQEVTKVQKSVTKGINATEDSNWRESGDYATDKAALQVKLQMLDADPTTKPSEKAQYQTQIKRDDVLEQNSIPYDDLKLYESTGLSEWRSMGDPKSDNYDPDTYQKLWTMDQLMAQGGASYETDDPTKQKYSAKQAGSGGRRRSPITGDFGKIGNSFAPKVQQYEPISTQAGDIPVITKVTPNIVHNISSSG